jgi:hypothetical protein
MSCPATFQNALEKEPVTAEALKARRDSSYAPATAGPPN